MKLTFTERRTSYPKSSLAPGQMNKIIINPVNIVPVNRNVMQVNPFQMNMIQRLENSTPCNCGK